MVCYLLLFLFAVSRSQIQLWLVWLAGMVIVCSFYQEDQHSKFFYLRTNGSGAKTNIGLVVNAFLQGSGLSVVLVFSSLIQPLLSSQLVKWLDIAI